MYKLDYKRFLIVGLLLVMVFAMSGCKKNEEGFVAMVDGEGITTEEFESDFQVYKRIYEQQLGEGAMNQAGEDGRTLEETLKENILEKLIIEKLVEKEAKGMNIVVTDEEIKEQLNEYIASVDGQEKFDEFLEVNEISKEFFEENIRKELIFNKHGELFLNDVKITDKEVEEYFNANKDDLVEIKASHILVKTEEDGKRVIDKLNSGEDFSSVAAMESIDSVSAVNGGSLGYFKKGKRIAEFENVAFALKVGETSKLIKTEVGYHIIKVEDRKDTLEALEDNIIDILKKEKYSQKLQELRNNDKIKILIDVKTK